MKPLVFAARPVRVEAMRLRDRKRETSEAIMDAFEGAPLYVIYGDRLTLRDGGVPLPIDVGDWIVRGPSGALWIVPDDQFVEQYQPEPAIPGEQEQEKA